MDMRVNAVTNINFPFFNNNRSILGHLSYKTEARTQLLYPQWTAADQVVEGDKSRIST